MPTLYILLESAYIGVFLCLAYITTHVHAHTLVG